MKRIAVLFFSIVLFLIGCREKKTPEARKPADTSAVSAKTDTVPEMPEGFKSIHQLELEAHRDTSDTSRQPPR